MPTTYEPIATTTTTGSVANIDFTSIPQTYTDLLFVATLKSTGVAYDVYSRFGNNSYDTGTNYSYTWLTGDGTTASSSRASNQTALLLDYSGSVINTNDHVAIYHFMNYSNTTTNKTILSRSNRAASGTDAIVGLWRSTSAINQIRFTLDLSGSSFIASGSTISLYGIKAA